MKKDNKLKDTIVFSGDLPQVILHKQDGKLPEMLFCVETTNISSEVGEGGIPKSVHKNLISYIRTDLIPKDMMEVIRKSLDKNKN